MKNLEYDRRVKMQELMILFLQRQEQLWVALPAVQSPCLKSYTEKTIERSQVDNDIGASIRTGAQNIQMFNTTAKMAAIGVKSDAEEGGRGDGDEGGEGGEERERTSSLQVGELDSPLKSVLLGKAKVIEKRKEGMMGGWKPVLALVTADNFLHLFDIPSSAKIQVRRGAKQRAETRTCALGNMMYKGGERSEEQEPNGVLSAATLYGTFQRRTSMSCKRALSARADMNPRTLETRRTTRHHLTS